MNAAINLARDPDEQVMLLSSDGSVAAERGGLGNSNNPQYVRCTVMHVMTQILNEGELQISCITCLEITLFTFISV